MGLVEDFSRLGSDRAISSNLRQRLVIARMNAIGDMTQGERREAEAACTILGHEPTGEQFMTCPPIDMCYWCGAKFRGVRESPRDAHFESLMLETAEMCKAEIVDVVAGRAWADEREVAVFARLAAHWARALHPELR